MKILINQIFVGLVLAALAWIIFTPMSAYARPFCLISLVIIVTLFCLVIKWKQLTWVYRGGIVLFVIALSVLDWYLLWINIVYEIIDGMP